MEASLLLVEDNPDDIELTIRAFRKNNFQNPIQVKQDGQEAIDFLQETESLPVLIMLDIKLPRVDGLEVLRFIRNNPRTTLTPVVMMTSSREEQDLLESYSLRANSFIRKPVDFQKFISAVESLSLYWLLLNEFPPRT